jgi:SAM-dependent methyltransferase
MSDAPLAADASYVLGHSERELARLRKQAAFFAEMTRDVLVKAGIAPGMSVLDVGCGVGDVTLAAAELVGTTGRVIGIDHSENALAVARMRADAEGRSSIRFERATIEGFDDYGAVDAIIGRFILLHLRDPARALNEIVGRVRPDTLIVFMELDLTTAGAEPELPQLARALSWIKEVYVRSGGAVDMGSRLAPTFRAAGLDPHDLIFTWTGRGSETAIFDFVADSISSLLPSIEKLGIATPQDVDIATLRERLTAEASADHAIHFPRFVGAWART